MLKLYHAPISFNSRRVWVALLEKELDFELVRMNLDGDQFQPDFLTLNPFHHIPVLVDGDFPVIESLAILDYLEAKYPAPPLLPTDPQALAVVRMVEMVTVNELLPATRPLIQQTMGLAEVTSTQLEQAQQQLATVLDTLNNWLGAGAYFSGDHLTLADIVAGTVIPILPTLGVSLNNYSSLQDWIKRLQQRPSWQQTAATPEQIEAFKAKMKQLMAKSKPDG
jgi:glutathione S-transferase